MVCFLCYNKGEEEVIMTKSFNLDKIFKDMNDDWFFMDSHAKDFVTLILYDTENYMIVGRTNDIVAKEYADNDYVKDYQNKFDDLYEEQTGHENSQYKFELVPVGVTSVALKYNL